MISETEDHSLIDDQGRILFYSAEKFIREVVDGRCCFICGTAPESVPFNDEHVIPDWVLRRFGLHDKRIVVPGGSELRYGQYKVPCCVTCNSRLGRTFEEPVSDLFSKGYEAVVRHMRNDGPMILFCWLSLIFLKTHLKDRVLRINRDQRIQSGMISDLYEWPELHHIHCVARSFYTEAELSVGVFGSIFVFPSRTDSPLGEFDYADYYPGRAMLLRLGDITIVAVLNDACAAINILWESIQRLTGPLSALQCRELLAHFSYANILLKNRPKFYSVVNRASETLTISVEHSEFNETSEFKASEFGHVLYSVVSSTIDAVPFSDPAEAHEHIRQGRWTFLFDSNGEFVNNSV